MVDIEEAKPRVAKKSPKMALSNPQKKIKKIQEENTKADKKPINKGFSPKYEESAPPKKAKKNKKSFEDESPQPLKKMKVDVDSTGKEDKKKKSAKFSEDSRKKGTKVAYAGKKEKKVWKKGGDSADGKKFKNKENTIPVEKLNKKETREKQKKVKEIRRKFKQEDIFDIGVKAKKVWEEVRQENCPEQKKDKLLNELHSLVQGNIKKIIFAHDTVRVVECLMALGSEEIRNKLFAELKEDILEMVKSKYAHFFVQKMLRYGTKEQKQIIIKQMEGKVAKLMKNKTAGHVIEMIYNDIASGPQRNSMLQEFLDYGFVHFKEPELRTVPEILEKYPNRKDDCIQNLQRNVEVLIRKGTFNHSLVHTVIYNYLLVAQPKQRSEVIEQLRESLIHMAHSREGTYAALQCIWHGTAKDRKAIIKSFKTFMLKTAHEEYGYMVLLGIFDSVDDTKIVGKAVLGELLENVEELFNNKYGIRVLKYLFCGRDPTYMNKDMVTILEKGDGNEHSKKERSVRHKELLTVAGPPVLSYIVQTFPASLYDAPATITLTCVINHSLPCPELNSLFSALAKLVAKPFAKGDSAPNPVENTGCSMLLKKVIAKDKERSDRGETTLASALISHVNEDGVESWIQCNRGCLLLVNLWDTGLPAVQAAVKEKVKQFQKMLQAETTNGAKVLVEKLG